MESIAARSIHKVSNHLEANIFTDFKQALQLGLLTKRMIGISCSGWDIETYDGKGIVITVANCPTVGLDYILPLSIKIEGCNSLTCLSNYPLLLSKMFEEWFISINK